MDIVNRLKSKNVQVREIPGWGPLRTTAVGR